MDNYYLKINIIHKDNKKYINTCELYKNNKRIKKYDRDISKTIYKYLKLENRYYTKYKDCLIIDDVEFIDKYVGIPADHVLHINPYVGMAITMGSLFLAALGINALENKYEDESNEISIVSTADEEDDKIPVSDIENISNDEMFYQPVEEDPNAPHVIIFSDNDDQLENSTNESLSLTSNEDIDDSCIYEFEGNDYSNDKYLQIMDIIYGHDVKPLSNEYGFSYEFILADATRENGQFLTRGSTIGGVGPLQVEWYIWDNQSLPDIDGTEYTFNCTNLNNISNDFGKMYEVSIYKQIFEKNCLSREELETNTNTILELVKDEYTSDNYNNLVNELNNFINLVDNATSFEEAKEQALICLNISDENIKQYNNAIEGFKAGELILHNNLEHIKNNNDNNVYNYKLSNFEIGLFTIWAQNKGITCIDDCLKVTFNREDTENAIRRTPSGDINYPSNIFSYLKNDEVVNMRLNDGTIISIKPQNLTLNNSIKK